jgi:hypothetical protein
MPRAPPAMLAFIKEDTESFPELEGTSVHDHDMEEKKLII